VSRCRNFVGDSSPEARNHRWASALTARHYKFMGDSYTFIDCPGSVEFAQEMRAAIPGVSICRRVVCEAGRTQAAATSIILRRTRRSRHPALSVSQQD